MFSGVEKYQSHEKVNPLSAKPILWLNTLEQFVGNSWQIVWVFVHFVRLVLKALRWCWQSEKTLDTLKKLVIENMLWSANLHQKMESPP